MVVTILLCVSLLVVGALMSKPGGWVVLTLSLIALLLAIGGAHFHIG